MMVSSISVSQSKVYTGLGYDNLPDEVILRIFRLMQERRDFFSLASVNKRFNAISYDAQAYTGFIPRFLSTETTDPEVQKMNPSQKIRLAAKIEKKLLSSDRLTSIFQMELVPAEVPRVKKLIGDYLVVVLGKQSPGHIEIHHIKTKQKWSYQAHRFDEIACELIPVPNDPLLITLSEWEGYKIWSLKKLVNPSNEDPLLYNNSMSGIATSDAKNPGAWHGDPIIETYQSWLGVGYHKHVIIQDCTTFSPLQSLKIDFKGVKQIQITETHVMLVTYKEVHIWELDAIKPSIQEKKQLPKGFLIKAELPPSDSSHLYGIAFAKMHQERVVIAYKQGFVQGSRYYIGEVRDLKTGELIRKLSDCCRYVDSGEFYTIEFQNERMFAGSKSMQIWNLNEKDGVHEARQKSFHEHTVNQIYALGQHDLFAIDRGIVLKRRDVPVSQLRDPVMIPGIRVLNHIPHRLASCHLEGRYLITETHEEIEGEDKVKNTISVYQLDLEQNH